MQYAYVHTLRTVWNSNLQDLLRICYFSNLILTYLDRHETN